MEDPEVHESLVKQILDLIDELALDKSVDRETLIDSMEFLRDQLNDHINIL